MDPATKDVATHRVRVVGDAAEVEIQAPSSHGAETDPTRSLAKPRETSPTYYDDP